MQFHAIQLWKATCWNWISSWPRDLSAEKHPSPRRCIRLHFDIHCVFIATMTSQSINTRAFEFLNERFANLKWRSITENAQRPTHGDLPVTSIAFSMTLNLRMSRILILLRYLPVSESEGHDSESWNFQVTVQVFLLSLESNEKQIHVLRAEKCVIVIFKWSTENTYSFFLNYNYTECYCKK